VETNPALQRFLGGGSEASPASALPPGAEPAACHRCSRRLSRAFTQSLSSGLVAGPRKSFSRSRVMSTQASSNGRQVGERSFSDPTRTPRGAPPSPSVGPHPHTPIGPLTLTPPSDPLPAHPIGPLTLTPHRTPPLLQVLVSRGKPPTGWRSRDTMREGGPWAWLMYDEVAYLSDGDQVTPQHGLHLSSHLSSHLFSPLFTSLHTHIHTSHHTSTHLNMHQVFTPPSAGELGLPGPRGHASHHPWPLMTWQVSLDYQDPEGTVLTCTLEG
jgi:hypothetical protein